MTIRPLDASKVLMLAVAMIFIAEQVRSGEIMRDLVIGDRSRGEHLTYSVYVPDLADDRGMRLPVLYLLHGYGASSREWIDGLDVAQPLDAMIADGEIAPLLVVMPDAGKSWYVDSAAFDGPGDMETTIVSTLVDAVDRRFPTDARAERRAIAGLSMGGFGALRLGFKFPECFCTVVGLSAGLFKPGGVSWQHGPGGRRWQARKQWYTASFGSPFNLGVYNQRNPFTYVDNLAHRTGPMHILLIAGDDDAMGAYDGTVEMFIELRKRGLKPELRISDGGHDHAFWKSKLSDVFRFVDRSWDSRDDPS
ncbi:alpha/beta hydrolase [Roseovarius sp. D22-M7]|uniref:alpha/beta hydrolase n=1 Tax=Roseovarius sp. D22-M7 TaxID=3127116 RepID=UPI00300FFFBF